MFPFLENEMNRQKTAVVLIIIAVFANSGCSMFARRQDPVVPEAQAFTNQVSTDSNDLPLPVEINQDIGKIVSGGGHFEGAGGNGKVNVNVNVNFNGNGWQQNVPGANGRTPSSVDSADTAANVAGSTGGSGGQFSGRMATGEVHHRDGAEKYVVKSGDTLMKISFEKYGSVYRWREILAANQGRIANAQALVAGTELTIDGRDYVVVERNGRHI